MLKTSLERRLQRALGPPIDEGGGGGGGSSAGAGGRRLLWYAPPDDSSSTAVWTSIELRGWTEIRVTVPFFLEPSVGEGGADGRGEHWFYLLFLSPHLTYSWPRQELTVTAQDWRSALLLLLMAGDADWRRLDPLRADRKARWLDEHHSDRRLWQMWRERQLAARENRDDGRYDNDDEEEGDLFWFV